MLQGRKADLHKFSAPKFEVLPVGQSRTAAPEYASRLPTRVYLIVDKSTWLSYPQNARHAITQIVNMVIPLKSQ